jgi:hypothetical protein
MDINRLIRITNHFDKIGAYTISDEFENKFIREGQALKPGIRNRRKSRNKVVTELAPSTESSPLESAWNTVSGFLRRQGDPVVKRNADNLSSLTYIETWKYILGSLSTMPEYSDPKKLNILRSIKGKILKAESNLKSAIPAAISSRSISPDLPTQTRIVNAAGDNEVVLREFLAWADYEDQTYKRNINKDSYINELRSAELDFTKLAFPDAIDSTPVTPPKPTPAPPVTAPASPTSPTSPSSPTAPSGGTRKPSPAPPVPPVKPTPSKPSSGGPGGTSPAGPGKASTKPTSTKPGKSKEDDANKELSKIVFRKYKAAHPKVEDRDILLGMRITESFTLKTYFDITKEPSLDGSIRAAIKASPYSQYFKETMLKIYESKLRAAKEKNSEPTKPVVVTPEKPSGGGESKTETKTDTKTEEKKNDDFGFRCNREGLFTEIKRMDTLHGNDPDKYMRNYFADIKRVIDCHESIRNSLNHKDNIQLDTSINILEAKYFSLINRTQFPY